MGGLPLKSSKRRKTIMRNTAKKKGADTVIAQVVMPKALYKALKAEAAAAGVSLSAYLKLLIADAREDRKAGHLR